MVLSSQDWIKMQDFFDKTFDDLSSILAGLDPKPFRLNQILRWVYVMGADGFGQMTDIPADLRGKLENILDLNPMKVVDERRSRDGTVKFLYELQDGERVEAVMIPEEGHNTLCVSTQAGCNMGCTFCETATIGLRRNLSMGEITAQVVYAIRALGSRIRLRNLVFMGMGEPLRNLDALIPALDVILDPSGLNYSPRRVTVSTCGWVPGIDRLARNGRGVNLAISLNAPDDNTRNRLMPVNRRYPLARLLEALRDYPLASRQRITFEYVLVGGINDSDEQARMIAGLLRGIPAKINLISYNATSAQFRQPAEGRLETFQQVLLDKGILATIRKSRGEEIGAACGQLRAMSEGMSNA